MPIDPIAAATAPDPHPRPGTGPPSDPSSSSTPSMQTDAVRESAGADRAKLYTADSIHAAINGAAHAATAGASAIAAGATGAIERLGPTLIDLGPKAADLAGSAARTAAPIAGTAFGAAALVIRTRSPYGPAYVNDPEFESLTADDIPEGLWFDFWMGIKKSLYFLRQNHSEMSERSVLAWLGFLRGELEGGGISTADYDKLRALLPPVNDDLTPPTSRSRVCDLGRRE